MVFLLQAQYLRTPRGQERRYRRLPWKGLRVGNGHWRDIFGRSPVKTNFRTLSAIVSACRRVGVGEVRRQTGQPPYRSWPLYSTPLTSRRIASSDSELRKMRLLEVG